MSLLRRVCLLAIVLSCAGAAFLLVNWAQKPKLALLYSGVSPGEAAKIVEKLRDESIPHELKDGGTAIYVPQEKVYALRLKLAGQGLPTGEQDGYQILDEEKIGASPFSQHVNYIRAIEGELAKTIKLIDGVTAVRVHVAKPENAFFASSEKQASATVVLRLRNNQRLSAGNVSAIVHLLAGSVEGLTPDKVVVVDSQGTLLSNEGEDELARSTSTILEYKARVEQYLSGKAEEMLTRVLGPNRATVKVDAVIDTTSLNETRETYDPLGKVLSRESLKSKSTSSPPRAEGEPAAAPSKEENTESEYMVGKTVAHKMDLPGKVMSLTVAAFVDLSAAAGKDGAAKITLKDVEEIVRKAIGLTAADSLKIVDTPFSAALTAEAPEPEQAGFFSKDFLLELARRGSLGLLVIGVLVAMKIFGGSRAKAGKTEITSVAGAGNLLPAQSSDQPDVLRAKITRALQQNPEEVKQWFLSWVDSDKGES